LSTTRRNPHSTPTADAFPGYPPANAAQPADPINPRGQLLDGLKDADIPDGRDRPSAYPPSWGRFLAERGVRLLRPGEHLLKPIRQLIESVNDTLKGQLDLRLLGPGTPQRTNHRRCRRPRRLTATRRDQRDLAQPSPGWRPARGRVPRSPAGAPAAAAARTATSGPAECWHTARYPADAGLTLHGVGSAGP